MDHRSWCRCLWVMLSVMFIASCGGGGGDSIVTTISGPGLNNLGLSPEVRLPSAFVQTDNNLQVVVDEGPVRNFASISANVLFATVTVCAPGDASRCQTIDHVQVDTGSVGLRILASKVNSLGLPAVPVPSGAAYECYPFVIGGLWGPTAVADVRLGRQVAGSVPVQLIMDSGVAGPPAPPDCVKASGGSVLSSVDQLGSNGILGIGSTTMDCGLLCAQGQYPDFVQYYSCPTGAIDPNDCVATDMPENSQVFNPVAAFTSHNNGVVIDLPAVPWPGAGKAWGELIFGINTGTNNQQPVMPPILLGMDWLNKPLSYLNITTQYAGRDIAQSYLDTGTNGLFFAADAGIDVCLAGSWYCPAKTVSRTADLSDGDVLGRNRVTVGFQVGNAEALFTTQNTAFGELAGVPPAANTFAWGLPFFFGKKVFLSIWNPMSQNTASNNLPWYAWK